MAEKQRYILVNGAVRARAQVAVMQAPDGYSVVIAEPTRNLEQNALLWVLLQAFADQLQWPVNGVMSKLSPEDWKDLLTAAYRRESQRVAMGIDGGMVMLGMRTSKMGKGEFAEFVDFVHSVAADRGVAIDGAGQ